MATTKITYADFNLECNHMQAVIKMTAAATSAGSEDMDGALRAAVETFVKIYPDSPLKRLLG